MTKRYELGFCRIVNIMVYGKESEWFYIWICLKMEEHEINPQQKCNWMLKMMRIYLSICCFVESITWRILPDVSVTLFVGQNSHVRRSFGISTDWHVDLSENKVAQSLLIKAIFLSVSYVSHTIWLFNIAMENHHVKQVNHLFLWAIYTMANC